MPAPPLDGLRVLDCSRLLPGPYCSRYLADLGADVVRVDHPDAARGDMVRAMASAFVGLNHGKGSVALDLTVAAHRDQFLALVDRADVVLESFRPGVLDRLGLGWSAIHARNPAAILCSITGYGQTGPDAGRAGHDIGYLARAGVLGLSGEADRPPLPLGVQVADLAGGALPGVIGILAALRERDGSPAQPGSGLGQHVDVSMTDGSRALLALDGPGALAGDPAPERGGGPLGGAAIACYRTYRCADGYVALGALEAKFWRAWCAGVRREDLVAQQFTAPGSDAGREIEALFAARTRDAWEAFAVEHDCCLESVLSPAESFARADEDLAAWRARPGADAGRRDGSDRIAPTLDAVDLDGVPRRVPAPGLRFSRSPLAAGGSTPATGADDALLADPDTRWPER
ncbi:MAG: CaiB/BaiF CoA-transferase family protein [Solirubrobacteraceae bacterium]|nr:CaiB/BaiF CoA-transferase family protein [Patulibacter sp.]